MAIWDGRFSGLAVQHNHVSTLSSEQVGTHTEACATKVKRENVRGTAAPTLNKAWKTLFFLILPPGILSFPKKVSQASILYST